jgi:hypothetical protein
MMKHPNGSQNNRGHTFSLKPGTTVMDGLVQHGLERHTRDKFRYQAAHRDSALEPCPKQFATAKTMRHTILHEMHFTKRLARLNSPVPKGRRLPPDGSFSVPERHVFRAKK